MFNTNLTYRIVNSEVIPGRILKSFIHNGNYYIVDIRIYKDGIIDCWELVDIEGFKQKVQIGWVVTQLPEGARVGFSLSNIFFTAVNVKSRVEEGEFNKEVEDELRDLNGEPTSLDICRALWEQYKVEPSEIAKEQLSQAYEAVPKHMRQFLGSMDDKDSEIRKILGR
jgi:hypothetical protein